MFSIVPRTVALPLKGNEFQANHNGCRFESCSFVLLLYLSKVTNFKQITTARASRPSAGRLLLYLSKVTNFKQITTCMRLNISNDILLLYLSKVTNFKQITTFVLKDAAGVYCCFTSQR